MHIVSDLGYYRLTAASQSAMLIPAIEHALDYVMSRGEEVGLGGHRGQHCQLVNMGCFERALDDAKSFSWNPRLA